jgi:peptidoglycan/xylan/chitin deacetylase (PgdA/CDA1 family)
MNYCALTFDDGPSNLTHLVLDRLEKFAIPATFFVVGKSITEETKPVMQRIVSLHCELGNHSWSFDPMDSMTAGEIETSILNTDNAISMFTGSPALFFRPPNLAVSSTLYKAIQKPFIGGIPAYDWEGCNRTPEVIASNILDKTKDGSIILLHDTQPLPHPTPEALDIIIPELIKREYSFVTLSDLFRIKNTDSQSLKNAMWDFV